MDEFVPDSPLKKKRDEEYGRRSCVNYVKIDEVKIQARQFVCMIRSSSPSYFRRLFKKHRERRDNNIVVC